VGVEDMDEVKLNYFMSMVRHLSFTKAAEDCHVVQATMSKQIADLENELGVQLFYRKHHSVSLTPAGERLAANAERFANQYRAINTSVQKLMLDYNDSLKIGVGLFESYLMEKPLIAFSKSNPDVEVNCMHYSYSTLVSHSRTGTIDIGIGTELCSNVLKEMKSIELFTDYWQVAASIHSDFWKLDPSSQAKLENQMIITTFNNEYEPVRPYCIKNKLKYKAFTYSNTYITQFVLIKSNMGIALLPSYLKPSLPPDIRMEDVLEEPLIIKFMVIYNPESTNASINMFIECCRDVFSNQNRIVLF